MVGQRTRSTARTLDGNSGKPPATNSLWSINPGLAAVEQVKVSTTGISAQTGHAGGGEIAVVFRSGTNQLHGSDADSVFSQGMVQRHYLQHDKSTAP